MASTTCPHFELLPFAKIPLDQTDHPLLVRLRKRLEREKDKEQERGCQMCGKPTKSNYLCLNPECFFIGCGREDKRHAVEHYTMHQRAGPTKHHHCVVLNTLAYQCWCYDCDDVIVPPVFTTLESDADVDAPAKGAASAPGRRKTPARVSLAQPSLGVGKRASQPAHPPSRPVQPRQLVLHERGDPGAPQLVAGARSALNPIVPPSSASSTPAPPLSTGRATAASPRASPSSLTRSAPRTCTARPASPDPSP